MATTILDRTGYLHHFPRHPKLDRLLAGYDPAIGYFKVGMERRNARALRQWLFGTKGLREVPDDNGGEMEFALRDDWILRLTCYERPYSYREPGWVDAEFIPPTMHNQPLIPQQWPAGSAEEAHAWRAAS